MYLLRSCARFVFATTAVPRAPPHRLRNRREQAEERLKRLLKMQPLNEKDELFVRLQELLFPEKRGDPLDRLALAQKLHFLAKVCETEDQIESLPPNDNVPVAQAIQKSQKKARRAFCYEEYRTRFVALHVLYLGWDYQGFASQDTGKTIEVRQSNTVTQQDTLPISHNRMR